MPSEDKDIRSTLLLLANSYESADELFKAVRKAHPDASKKEIVLAALSVMIDQSETDGATTRKLHALAIENRGSV